MQNIFANVYDGKTVLITGHTGFKGSWLSLWLNQLGARVVGYALAPPTDPSLFVQAKLSERMDSRIGEIRDLENLSSVMSEVKPEFVFHLAAQSLVGRSYAEPIETFQTNIMGVANVLEASKRVPAVRVVQIVTTDKCYENRNWVYPYRETDALGGHDPYSASKAAAEIVADSYRSAFLAARGISVSTARAGNVIGGGDWAEDRIIPDCVRFLISHKPVEVRNPDHVRPWQHVLEPLAGYLCLAAVQYQDPVSFSQAWNFGPHPQACVPVRRVVEDFLLAWGQGEWHQQMQENPPHEAEILKLDWSKARERLGWQPALGLTDCLRFVADWYKRWVDAGSSFDASKLCIEQILAYTDAAKKSGCTWAK